MGEYVYGTDGHEGHWLTGEEIVRCRDCKHMLKAKYVLSNREPYEKMECWVSGEPFGVEPDGFCKWGERREK